MQRRTALLVLFAVVVALFIGVSTVQADEKEAYGTGNLFIYNHRKKRK